MTPPLVISNTSPLIALHRIDRLSLLKELFSAVTIPPAVAREAESIDPWPEWLNTCVPTRCGRTQLLSASLGPGEREAIGLAMEHNIRWIILDERPARQLATSLRLPVIGTLGVLLASKRKRLITSMRTELNHLVDSGFRASPELLGRVLTAAGEQ